MIELCVRPRVFSYTFDMVAVNKLSASLSASLKVDKLFRSLLLGEAGKGHISTDLPFELNFIPCKNKVSRSEVLEYYLYNFH